MSSINKRWNIAEANPREIELMARQHNVTPLVARLLINRKISAEDAGEYLQPKLKSLGNFDQMAGIKKAAERFADAIDNSEKVLAYGDVDADGSNGIAILQRFGEMCGCRFLAFVPDRGTDGYGLHKHCLEKIFADDSPTLVVTADVGISAHEAAEYCREQNVGLLLTDHHTPPAELPRAYAIVNPHLEDCPYPFKDLCGAGVAFALCVVTTGVLKRRGYFAEGGEPNLCELLPLVAVATVADVVSLRGDNRVLVREGLKRFSGIPGLVALANLSGIDPGKVSAGQIGFVFGPRINSSGRVSTAMTSIELLTTDDPKRAEELAAELDELNKERQDLEAICLEEAFSMLEANPELIGRTIVLYGEGWAPGVVGLAASRIMDKFYRPTIIITNGSDGLAKGSGRSIPGFNMYDALLETGEHLVGYGGHPMAAGLKIAVEKVDDFRKAFESSSVAAALSEEDLVPVVEIDTILSGQDLTVETHSSLRFLEPYGIGNRSPVFCAYGAKVSSRKTLKEKHVKLSLDIDGRCIDAMGWGMAAMDIGDNIDVAFTMDINEFRGKSSLQLILKDLRPC